LKYKEFVAQLRGLAILVVVLMHYSEFFPISYASLPFAGNGYYGVSLFFAISGFLITANLIKRYGGADDVNLRAFYDMRAARILPCLGLAVAILSIVSLSTKIYGFAFPPGLSPGAAIVSLLKLQFNNYYLAGALNAPAWAVLWSISIEEAFYLVYPIAIIMLRSELRLTAILVGIVVYGPFARPNLFGIYSYFGSFDQMALGALAALAAQRLGPAIPSTALPYLKVAGGALVLVTYAAISPREHFTFGPSLIGIGASLMLFASAIETRDSRRTLLGRIGSLSYEIYLFHSMVFLLLALVLPRVTGPLAYLELCAAMLLCYWLCTAIAKYFTNPVNALLRARSAPAPHDSRLGSGHNRVLASQD
jgi:peptidoglycan/LPS O-acetylase OafA/YrhL